MQLDTTEFRRTLGTFATGITIVTLWDGDDVHGMTANSFTSVSLDPPLILICVDRRNHTHKLIQEKGAFGINILREDMESVSSYYAGDRSQDVTWQFNEDKTRAPILDGALGWLDCRLHETFDGGDHSIFVGKVLELGRAEGNPLLYYSGGYRKLG